MSLLRRRRRGQNGEEGQIIPVVLTAIIAILAITMMLLQVGRAGILRTGSQTAADSAALAAMESAKSQLLSSVFNGTLPRWVFDIGADDVRPAADEYAKKNDGEVTDLTMNKGLNKYGVEVSTQSQAKQGGELEGVQDEQAEAEAIAVMELPDCYMQPAGVYDPDGEDGPIDPTYYTGFYCGSGLVVKWDNVAGTVPGWAAREIYYTIKPMFDIHLADEMPTFALPGLGEIGDLNHAKGAPISRAKMLQRALWWDSQGIPYSMSAYHPGPGGMNYRTDCSGFVSMAWGLKTSLTTTTIPGVAKQISKEQLKTGDVLLNNEGAGAGSHVVMFIKWANEAHTAYVGIEQRGGDGTVKSVIPYAYFSEPNEYLPWRYDGVLEEPPGGSSGSGNN